jgi:hypothetical protein
MLAMYPPKEPHTAHIRQLLWHMKSEKIGAFLRAVSISSVLPTTTVSITTYSDIQCRTASCGEHLQQFFLDDPPSEAIIGDLVLDHCLPAATRYLRLWANSIPRASVEHFGLLCE